MRLLGESKITSSWQETWGWSWVATWLQKVWEDICSAYTRRHTSTLTSETWPIKQIITCDDATCSRGAGQCLRKPAQYVGKVGSTRPFRNRCTTTWTLEWAATSTILAMTLPWPFAIWENSKLWPLCYWSKWEFLDRKIWSGGGRWYEQEKLRRFLETNTKGRMG